MPFCSPDEIVSSVGRGEAVSFPTDTVPALAVSPAYSSRIFHLKQREPDKPLILMVASAADIWPYVAGNERERRIWAATVQEYWPGPITFVFPASERVPRAMNPLDPTTIGARVPAHPLALDILSRTGPLATTSANRSGASPLLTAAEIARIFPGVFVLQPDGWGTGTDGQPSTVARWNGDGWDILRRGKISPP